MKTNVKARFHGGFIFVDNFDDLLRHPDWIDAANLGTITESGGVLTLALAAGVHGDFWIANDSCPIAMIDLSLHTSKYLEITTKLNSFTLNDEVRTGLYITDQIDKTKGIHFTLVRDDDTNLHGLEIGDMGGAQLKIDLTLTAIPVWLRIRTSGSQGSGSVLYFDYSHDGYSWIKFHVVEDEAWNQVGLLCWNWDAGGWSAISAPFEYFKIKEILEKL